jgi:hypothetical protein
MAETLDDALVIADAEGHYYVIPHELIRQTRVPDELKDAIDDLLGVDTVGFASLGLGYSLVGPLTAARQEAEGFELPPGPRVVVVPAGEERP